jgi:hypothetical protein
MQRCSGSRLGTGWIASGKPPGPSQRWWRRQARFEVCIATRSEQDTSGKESASRPGLEQEDTAICAVSTLPLGCAVAPLHIEGGIRIPAVGLPVGGSHGNGHAAQMHLLPEVQGVQVQGRLTVLQGESGVPGHSGKPQAMRSRESGRPLTPSASRRPLSRTTLSRCTGTPWHRRTGWLSQSGPKSSTQSSTRP